jgi:hypothetical protein
VSYRKGSRVRELTKKVGSQGRIGTVVDVRDDGAVEVRWDDGHTVVLWTPSLTTVKESTKT